MDAILKILVPALIFMSILGLMIPANCSRTIFYVYGSMMCPECEEFSTELKKTFGEGSLVFREISQNSENLKQLVSIYEAAFPTLEKSKLVIPLTVIVVDGAVKGVVSGKTSMDLLRDIATSAIQDMVLVYPDGRIVIERDPQLSKVVAETVLGGSIRERDHPGFSQVLFPVLVAAAADSINPCTFTLFTALLLMTMFFKGRGGMIRTGIAFISAVYIAYYLLGLGLIKVFMAFTWLKYLVAVAGIALGSYEISMSLIGGFKSPLPRPIYNFTSNLVGQVSKKAIIPLAFGAGFIVSFTLLPCSAGPYFVALSLIAGLSDLEKYLVLMMYNAIFVAPLVAILASVGAAAHLSKSIKKFRSKRVDLLSITSSSLLIAVCIWALLQ